MRSHVGELVEALSETRLADRAGVSGSGRLRIITERQEEPAQLRVLLPDPFHILGTTAPPSARSVRRRETTSTDRLGRGVWLPPRPRISGPSGAPKPGCSADAQSPSGDSTPGGATWSRLISPPASWWAMWATADWRYGSGTRTYPRAGKGGNWRRRWQSSDQRARLRAAWETHGTQLAGSSCHGWCAGRGKAAARRAPGNTGANTTSEKCRRPPAVANVKGLSDWGFSDLRPIR